MILKIIWQIEHKRISYLINLNNLKEYLQNMINKQSSVKHFNLFIYLATLISVIKFILSDYYLLILLILKLCVFIITTNIIIQELFGGTLLTLFIFFFKCD